MVIKGLSWSEIDLANGFSKIHVHMFPIAFDQTLESPCGCHFVFYLIESNFAGLSPNRCRIPSALIPIQRCRVSISARRPIALRATVPGHHIMEN